MTMRPNRPRRSVLYVPATNAKALAKIATLACDAVVIDLEDAVAPSQKIAAREAACRFITERGASTKEIVLRINALSSEWGRDDLRAAREASPDAVLSKNEKLTHELEPDMHKIRDAVIRVIGSKSLEEVSTPEGREVLKTELRDAINQEVHHKRAENVYFVTFITQ